MNIYETLSKVQKEIVVPKSRTNKFGGYNYRNAEDIMEAAKKACANNEAAFYVSDDVQSIDGRFYVVATATFCAGNQTVNAKGYAREQSTKKGMDEAQITGTASSYARKYALCGLFGIDGQDDPDAMDNREETTKNQVKENRQQPSKKEQIEEVKAYCAKYAALKERQLQEIYTIICQRVKVSRLDDMSADQATAALSMLKYWCDQAAQQQLEQSDIKL